MRDELEPGRGSGLAGATRSLWRRLALLIALRAISTLTRGSSLKRNSYSGFVDPTGTRLVQLPLQFHHIHSPLPVKQT